MSLEEEYQTSIYRDYSIFQLRAMISQQHYKRIEAPYKRAIYLASRIRDIKSTISSYKRKLDTLSMIVTESGIAEMSSGDVSSSVQQVSENLVDVVGDLPIEVSSGVSTVPSTGQTELLSLQEFLKRPVPLAQYDIAVGASSGVVIPAWDTFTLDPAVRAKLRNYAYLKADMHVRIAVSGSPFHYGRILASYQPYPERNANIQAHLNGLSINPAWRPLFLNYLSQAPGSATIDVKANQPLEMTFPFISTKPMHRLFNSGNAAIGTGTSYDDLADCGSLYLYTLNDVQSVSSGTSSAVSVFVYGWLENVELGTSTATQVAILTESKTIARRAPKKNSKPKEVSDKSDERKRGPVETISSSIASFANHLTTVPYIGPIATATTMAASAVSDISSVFGWAKPVMIKEGMLVKNQPFQNGALTIGSDTNYRIVLDPKQELSVDPRVCGIETDDMNIGFLASIPSYFTTFTWAPTDDPLTYPMWQTLVNPGMNTNLPLAGETYIQPTAMAMATDMFAYWRGSITYRFEIVCSSYHRGKLAFYFDPNWGQNNLINLNLSLNKQYFKIIDIQETQMVEFTVNWAYPRAWSRILGFPENTIMTDPALITTSLIDFGNGFVGVTPFTTLQSPDDSSISVNVYAYSNDMQVNYLDNSNLKVRERLILTESAIYDPEDIASMDLNSSSADTGDICLYHFGEQPVSFRSLLKRYVTSSIFDVDPVTGDSTRFILYSPIVPPIVGGYGSTEAPRTLFDYLRYAYLGLRGGVRYRYRMNGNMVDSAVDGAVTSLVSPSDTNTIPNVTTANGRTSNDALLTGSVNHIFNSNGGLEVELPMYTNNLFLFSFADDLVGSNTSGDMEETWVRNFQCHIRLASPQERLFHTLDVASAEDFTLMRFQGSPFYSVDTSS